MNHRTGQNGLFILHRSIIIILTFCLPVLAQETDRGAQDTLGLELVSMFDDEQGSHFAIELFAINDLDPWYSLGFGLSWQSSSPGVVLDSVRRSPLADSSWDIILPTFPLDTANSYKAYQVRFARAFASGLQPGAGRKVLGTYYFSYNDPGLSRSRSLPVMTIDTQTFNVGSAYQVRTTGSQILLPFWAGSLTIDEQLGVESENGAVPALFTLHQNYPNPFNPSTEIQFELSVQGDVQLEILNVLGQSIRSLQNGSLSAGSYSVLWDGRTAQGVSVASGVYFYRLTTDGFGVSRKMLLLK